MDWINNEIRRLKNRGFTFAKLRRLKNRYYNLSDKAISHRKYKRYTMRAIELRMCEIYWEGDPDWGDPLSFDDRHIKSDVLFRGN
jgi:hypothetical protein